MNNTYSDSLTYIGKAIDFDLNSLELITHFSKTKADLKLSNLIEEVVYCESCDVDFEPKEKIKKRFIEIYEILEDINYTIPKELEDGFILEEEYHKQDSIFKTTFFDSSGEEYSLGIIYLGLDIVEHYLRVLSTKIEHKSKLKSKHKSKSKKAKLKSKSKGFGKKQQ